MKRFTDCPVSPVEIRDRPPYAAKLMEQKGAKRSRAVPRRVRVEHDQTGQALELTSDEPLVAYGFPEEGRHRVARRHGDEHHDAWAAGEDLPALVPDKDHEVAGIAVVFRALPRELGAPAKTIAGKSVTWATVQVPMQDRNEARIELRKLLTDAQIPGVAEAPTRRGGRRRV